MSTTHIKIPAEGTKIVAGKPVPDNPIIPFIEGDGIGVDITPVMKDVVDAAVAFVGDDGLGTAFGKPGTQIIAAIAFIADQFSRGRHGRDAGLGDLHIVNISGGYHQHAGTALHVADGVDLGVSPAACLADTIGQGPPFAPPAVRCALMQVLSMNNLSGTPSTPASVEKIPSYIPRSAQRTKRL